MIHIKTMTVDHYYSTHEANNLTNIVYDLTYTQHDFGKDIDNFNFTPNNADELFSKVFKMNLKLIEERSGLFRLPEQFVHFESFDNLNEWLFVVALQRSTLNIFEHQSGATTALDEYKFNYRNLLEWDLMINYVLKPGQGILFRPWLFHSFDTGLIQLFRLQEHEKL